MARIKITEALAALTEAAQNLNIQVRTERLVGAGGVPVTSGLARVEDKWVIFLEKRQPPRERLEALVDALSRFELSGRARQVLAELTKARVE